ncbi:MAG: acireductone synthase [Phycisphaerae bacterium]
MSGAPRAILLDIEGTTSSISFVFDVLFPFARRELARFLEQHWHRDDVLAAREQIARDAAGDMHDHAALEAHLTDLMNRDVKATGLKQLQGLIWQEGYASGELRSHVYADVAPALRRWSARGCDVRIYSSGSVAAQKLFFAHTEFGDLTAALRGHYDTTTGPKSAPASYEIIARAFEMPPNEILFLSDAPVELDAAREAGLRTGLAARPGNKPTPGCGHQRFETFDSIH